MRLGSVLLAGTVLLAGCGGGGDEPPDATDDPTTATDGVTDETSDDATDDPAASETPEDGGTMPGTELELGEAATFTWNPTQNLQGTVELSVDRIEQTTMKAFSAFKLDKASRQSTPYYVYVTATNEGTTNLGGEDLPLFLDNGSDVLHPYARINGSHEPCPSRPLPEKFRPGKTAELCLVFLAPDRSELSAIALRPVEDLAPILWTGEISEPRKGKKRRNRG